MEGHKNLFEYANDERELYKIWDDDLKKYIRRRQIRETLGSIALIASLFAWTMNNGEFRYYAYWGVLAGALFLYSAIKLMVDESNINYLMHEWDLRDAIGRFRAEEKRKIAEQ
jgi:hypothetical protein